MSSTSDTSTRPKADFVFQTICDLAEIHKAANRARISQITGLTLTQLDDILKRLKNEGRIMSIAPGLFEPVPQMPPDRAITITQLPDGLVKIEVADGPMLELTPREARIVGRFLAGAAQELQHVDHTRHMAAQISRLTAQVVKMGGSMEPPGPPTIEIIDPQGE